MSKRRESKGEADKEERSWKDLPIELLQLISSTLCRCDCIRFCLTCKPFMSVTPPLQPNPLLIQSNYGSQQLPWLMSFPKISEGVLNLYNPISSDAYIMEIPELAGAIIRDANYGWLLMSQGYYSVFFFNPLTKETIKLPDLDNPYNYVGITFSAPPDASDCIVFGITENIPEYVEMIIHCKVEGIWRGFESRYDCKVPYEFMASDCNPVFCYGVFYCLSKDGKLAIFDPGRRDDLSWRVFPVPPIFSFSKLEDFATNRRGFLVEYNGEIFSIFMGFFGKSIWVSKLDRLKMVWVKLESLGDKVLFLSPTKKGLLEGACFTIAWGANVVAEIGQILVSTAGIVLGSI
ncbi:hypothetical protein AQUCO_03500275v1 [Aquilegia coerulea]|uniref:F-box domain-containing protein n=1 Tax=Aquilegia coerulea TaxID=218851 RepID=A0A2G5CX16_AQUCA|nr:hypothetical protein AQUCO_03500275v1 [Aquilegia coerulea]